jgi:hypothetical protein
MGGIWRKNLSKFTVEQCRVLSAAALTREGALHPNSRRRCTATWNWADADGCQRYREAFCDIETDATAGTLRLRYEWMQTQEAMDYPVRLTTTPLPWGGLKWWFICPLTRYGVPCGRRVGKLYLLNRYFACRHCHEMTYRSCQESHKYDAILGGGGREQGTFGKRRA